jgi:hypothetical protein
MRCWLSQMRFGVRSSQSGERASALWTSVRGFASNPRTLISGTRCFAQQTWPAITTVRFTSPVVAQALKTAAATKLIAARGIGLTRVKRKSFV